MAATPTFKYQLCDSEFYDANISWHTVTPNLSPCFRYTILVWLPACFFVFTFFSELASIRQANSLGFRQIPWNGFNFSRILVVVMLFLLKFTEVVSYIHIVVVQYYYSDLVENAERKYHDYSEDIIYKVDKHRHLVLSEFIAPIIQTICYVVLGGLYFGHRRAGVHTSGPIWFYLLLLLISESINYYSLVFNIKPVAFSKLELLLQYVHFPMVVLLFVLECYGDSAIIVDEADDTSLDEQPESPEMKASYFSSITYWWFNRFLSFGYRNKIDVKNLWKTLPRDRASRLVPKFRYAWVEGASTDEPPSGLFWSKKAKDKRSPDYYYSASGKRLWKNNVWRILCKLFWFDVAVSAYLKLIHDILQYLSPLILKKILAFMRTKDEPYWHGVLFASLLLITPTFQSLILNAYWVRVHQIGLNIRSMIVGSVYRKSLQLSGNSRLESTSGEIVNLMAVDSQRFQDLVTYINLLWSAPFQVILSCFLLYNELGWSIFAGVFCMCLLMPANAYIANKMKFTQIKLSKTKDKRIKQVNEILGGIKVIKLCAWENSFMSNLINFRNKETEYLSKILNLDAVSNFLWACSPFFVACVTFAVYVSVDKSHVLDAEKAFVSIALFNLLRFPLVMLPSLMTSLILTSVSARRITKFLNCNELIGYLTRNKELEAIAIEGGTLSWSIGEDNPVSSTTASSQPINSAVESQKTPDSHNDSHKPILMDIDLQVKVGSFVAVVGQVASGKSSLLSAILGEMHRISGRFNICQSMTIAYVPQQAWIQNMTLRDNILFGSAYDEIRYKQVLDACCLQQDLEQLPGGDLSEIGEKGINLSGGQKQRISLARACYSDSDIYLLDDPLSALDSHVAKHVYESVLNSKTGILRNKTRVLATNALFVIPYVDQIVALDKGRIVESGTYDRLMRADDTEHHYLKDIMHQYSGTQAQAVQPQMLSETKAPDVAPAPSIVKIQEHAGHETKHHDHQDAQGQRAQLEKSHIFEDRALKSVGPSKPAHDPSKLVEVEKVELGSVNYGVYLGYFKAVSLFWAVYIAIALVGASSFQVATNIWLSLWASDSEKPKEELDSSPDYVTMRLLVYSLFGGLQCCCVLIAALGLCKGAVRASKRLHSRLMEGVMHSPMAFFDTTPIGRIVNRFAKDIDVVDSSLPGAFRAWINNLLQVVSTLFVICYSFPTFLIIIIPMAVVYGLIQKIFIVTTRQLKRTESITRSPIYSNFNETLSGISTIRAYNCMNRFISYSDGLIDRNLSCNYPNMIANRWLAVRLELFGNIITTGAALFSVYNKGIIGAGIAGLSISYSLNITQTLSWFVRMTSDLETNIVSVERIFEYANNKPEDRWIKEESRPSKGWPREGQLEVQNYSTRYREDTDLVLRDISLNIKAGEKIGIIGRTGSGKSSLSLALFRIIEPVSGHIKIDNIDLVDLGLHDIRSRITIIPQDPILFSGTLRFNLDPSGVYSDADIWRALELAHLKVYILSLNSGLDYQVSEYGGNFSVGQRQLICLARAILRKTKVLVLDEATASVDLETDSIVQKTIRDIFSDCTIITIAHRLHTILDSDRILVLDSGTVKEIDSPSKLIRDPNSAFSSLVRDAGIDAKSLVRQSVEKSEKL